MASQRRAELARELASAARTVGTAKLVVAEVSGDGNELRQVALAVRDHLGAPGVVILGSGHDGKGALVALVTPDLLEGGVAASELIAGASRELGGGGSRDPELAQAGGPKGANLASALELATRQAEETLARQ